MNDSLEAIHRSWSALILKMQCLIIWVMTSSICSIRTSNEEKIRKKFNILEIIFVLKCLDTKMLQKLHNLFKTTPQHLYMRQIYILLCSSLLDKYAKARKTSCTVQTCWNDMKIWGTHFALSKLVSMVPKYEEDILHCTS